MVNFITQPFFTVHLIGKYEDRVFEDRSVSFTIGEGSEANIIRGVEIALEKFKKGECSRLKIKSQYAFGDAGSAELNIPGKATVVYTVTLKNFERAKESWALDSSERVQQAELLKEKGTNYFKNGKFELAIRFYRKVQAFLDTEKGNFFMFTCYNKINK